MWNLVRLGLTYHRRTLLTACGIAFGVGLIQLLFVWIESGPGEFDHQVWLVLPKLGFVGTAIAGLVAFEIEDKERRALLHLPLPVTLTKVGFARVVLPTMIIILGTVAMALLTCVILLAVGARPTAGAALQLLFSVTLELFFLQLLLAFLTFVRGSRERLRALLGIATLVVVMVMACVAWILLAGSGSYLMVGLGTAAMTLGLMGVSVRLFEQRESFTSG